MIKRLHCYGHPEEDIFPPVAIETVTVEVAFPEETTALLLASPKTLFPPLFALFSILFEITVLFDCVVLQTVVLFTITVLFEPAPLPEIITPDGEGEEFTDGVGDGEKVPEGEGVGKTAAAEKLLPKLLALAEKSPNTLWFNAKTNNNTVVENKK